MSKNKILIATTNAGKLKEFKEYLKGGKFEIISLNELKKSPKEPPENNPTIWGNALTKAFYYGEQTKLLTIADDSGLFIDTLNGWPGVISARIAKNNQARRALVLKKMQGKKNRKASFRAALAFYDPKDKTTFLSIEESVGKILTKEDEHDNGFGYDPIFYSLEKQKPFSVLTMKEKNSCSHRGKALKKIKIFLEKQYK